MQRSFLKNLFWLQILNWLIKPIWILLIEREIQLQLGDELYGRYAVHVGIGVLFAVLLDAGINAFISREIAMQGRLQSWKRILYLRLGLTGLYVLLVLLFSFFQAAIQWGLIGLVLMNQLLAAFVLLSRSVLQGRHQFKWDSLVSVVDRFVAIVLLVAFFQLFGSSGLGSHGVEKFLIAQGIGYAVALLLGMWFTGGDILGRKTANVSVEVEISGSSAPEAMSIAQWLTNMGWFVVLGLSMSAFTRLDIQMLQWFTLDISKEIELPLDFPQQANPGFLANGLYAKGYRFLDAALIFSSMLSVQLLPLFSKRIADKMDVSALVWLGFRIVFLVSVLAVCVGYCYGTSLMQLFYHIESSAEAHNMGQLFFGFMLVFMAMSTVHVFGTLLTASGDVRWLSFLAILCLIVNIGIDSMRIPMLGPFGALEGGLATQGLFALGCMYRAHSKGLFTWQWSRAEYFVYQLLVPAIVFTLVKTVLGFSAAESNLTAFWAPLAISVALSAILQVYLSFGAEIKQWVVKR